MYFYFLEYKIKWPRELNSRVTGKVNERLEAAMSDFVLV
jgi:hypothetical protein